MATTLNQDDIKLLKSVFATKNDLSSMEKRQDAKYATKTDLTSMEKRQDAKYATKDAVTKGFAMVEKRFDDMDAALAKYSTDIETRVQRLENVVGIPTFN